MSRYLQEQCGWLLALLPGRLGQETLRRFGWPAVSASEVQAKGEALGVELEARGGYCHINFWSTCQVGNSTRLEAQKRVQ